MRMIFSGRNRVRYSYSCFGYTRGGGKTWHGGIDIEGIDSKKIRMPYYKGKKIKGKVITARIVKDHSNLTWEWGYYICIQLDNGQTPDEVNFLYFCHCSQLLVKVGDRVQSGDVIAVMGNTGNAALASPPFEHVHFEVRATATGRGLDPTDYAGLPNTPGTYTDGSTEEVNKEMQVITIGPVTDGDAMRVWELTKELDLPYMSMNVKEGE